MTAAPGLEPHRPLLFTPFRLRGLTFRNRVVVSPMCQYVAVEGRVQAWHLAHHARLALGGVGGAVVEATAVSRDGRITHGCTGLWEDGQIAGMAEIVATYRREGVAIGVQIGHAGRKASTARSWDGAGPILAGAAEPPWTTVAPSALPAQPGWPAPREISVAEIGQVVADFRDATGRALAAGFDFVEIHGAHGYLLNSFLSPLSNHRTDHYGGSGAARMRLALEVAEAVRAAWPADRPLLYRASVVDGGEGGLTIADTVALAQALRQRGVDLLDCSAGGIGGPVALGVAKVAPGHQIPLAAHLRHEAGIATMAVGLIMDPLQAEEAVSSGAADLIALGREILADSNWTYRAARVLGLADPHDVLPPAFAFYLKRREALLAGS